MANVGTKVTMKFVASGDTPYGWSEAYYLPSAASNDLGVEQQLGINLVNARLPLLAQNCRLLGFTVTDLGQKRRYAEVAYANAFGPPASDDVVALPGYALLLIKETQNKVSTGHTFLKGVRADEWAGVGNYTPGPAFGPAMNVFKQALISGGWGFLGETSAVDQRRAAITMVAQGADGRPVISAGVPAVAPIVGQKYKTTISGVQGAAAINGQHVATYTGAGQWALERRTPIFPYVGGGQITYFAQVVVQIASVIVQGWAQRKDGRPFFLLRGRSKARNLG